MDFSAREGKPHVVCIPSPAQGHINAMLKLAKVLHYRGFHITFVHTEFNYNRILTTRGASCLDGLPDFRFETIPDSLPPAENPTNGPDIATLCYATQNYFTAPFRQLLKRLNESGGPEVTCIVSDSFLSFTLEIAQELGIPDVFFCSVSACGFMGFFSFKELFERGIVPLKGESLDTPIDWIAGLKNIRIRDLPSPMRTTDPNDVFFNFCKDEAQASLRATAIIMNTFDDLEGPVLDAMSKFLPPIYAIGPLTLMHRKILDNPLNTIGSNLWKEDSTCLEWLDGKDPGSVLYLNFGSLAVMTRQQLTEFAWGLANSGHNFLGVIRPNIVTGDSDFLSKEFFEEIEGRGLLTSWCPQEEVLMHPSIGGFLTHCGWNSAMESICGGVPMICWPYFGDQQTNCRYLCNGWVIGMEISGDVKRKEVELLIRELMGGEKGAEMRRMALRWKESAIRSTERGGKSFVNLERVIKDVLLQRKDIS